MGKQKPIHVMLIYKSNSLYLFMFGLLTNEWIKHKLLSEPNMRTSWTMGSFDNPVDTEIRKKKRKKWNPNLSKTAPHVMPNRLNKKRERLGVVRL